MADVVVGENTGLVDLGLAPANHGTVVTDVMSPRLSCRSDPSLFPCLLIEIILEQPEGT